VKLHATIPVPTWVWLLLAISPLSLCYGDEMAALPQVKATDLHAGRATIIGYLGRPLGEVVTIRGSWHAPPKLAKDPAPIFLVTHLNGKPITPPLEFTHARVRAVHDGGRSGQDDDDRWEWKAAFGGKLPPPEFRPGESWELAGGEEFSTKAPVAVWDERPVAVSRDFGANGFLATFDFMRARRITTKAAETPK
jgi:hypothetical protein